MTAARPNRYAKSSERAPGIFGRDNTQILKSSNPQILKSSDPQILRSSNPRILKSSNQACPALGNAILAGRRRLYNARLTITSSKDAYDATADPAGSLWVV